MFRFKELCSQQGFTLSRLAAFMEVADAGGIAKAVGKDPVTQSKYSRQIGELEDFFGTKLFAKHGKTMVLTGAGQELVRVAREALSGFADFRDSNMRKPVRFTIGGGITLLHGLIAPQLGVLLRHEPLVLFRLRNMKNREVISGLQDMSLDFGLVKETSMPANLIKRRLGELHYGLYVPKILVPKGIEATWAWVVENLPIACQESEGEAIRELSEKGSVRPKPPLSFSVESETYIEIARVLSTMSFAAILPCIMSTQMNQDDFIQVRSPILQKFSLPVFLVWNQRTLRQRQHAVVIKDKLLELLKL